jgi:predicted nucleotidyltransferase
MYDEGVERPLPIPLDHARLAEFCRRWQVAEFSLFGSAVSGRFRADSDVDVLVTFAPGARPTLFTLVSMQEELEGLFGRRVDLAERDSVERSHNDVRRRAILDTRRVLYAA